MANLWTAGFIMHSIDSSVSISNRDRMIEEFNIVGSDVDILVTNINLSSHRLNLQHAC